MLTLMKRGYIAKMSQKRIYAKLNLWIRGPGIGILIPGTLYTAWIQGAIRHGHEIQLTVMACFCIYNGMHYMEVAIKNYQMHLTRAVYELKWRELESKERKIQEKEAQLSEYWVSKEQATVKK